LENIQKKEKVSNNDNILKQENLKNNLLSKFNETYKKILFDKKEIIQRTNEEIKFNKDKIENLKIELKKVFTSMELIEKEYSTEKLNFEKVKKSCF